MKEFQLQPFLIKNNTGSFLLNWKIVRYLIFFTLIALAVSSISIIPYGSEIVLLTFRILQLAGFVFLGIIHSDLIEKRPIFTHHSLKEKFYFSFVLTLAIYGALLLFYSIVKTNMERMAISSSSAFLVPLTIVQAWNYYLLLQDNKLMIWNGYQKVSVNADIAYLNSILIQIRLSKKSNAKEESSFLINTPLSLELGKIFNSFLNIENNDGHVEIECIDESNKPFSWKFYVVSFGGLYKRMLHPDKNLQNNGNIKRNAVILAKRVVAA